MIRLFNCHDVVLGLTPRLVGSNSVISGKECIYVNLAARSACGATRAAAAAAAARAAPQLHSLRKS